MDQNSSSTDSISMDTQVVSKPTPKTINHSKRKGNHGASSTTAKRSKLTDMIFYDGNPHPAAFLHDLRPEISSVDYHFDSEETPSKQTRFRCSLSIEQNVSEPLTVIGVGRSKQFAKNMAAQQALMKLYPTYRPPTEAILSEDLDMYQPTRFVSTRPPSLQNDPTSLIDSIRKHLTTKSIAIKTPLQLFNELFINNQRLNSSTSSKNRIELIDNAEHLVVVRVTAMDQQFYSVSAAKNVAQNDACQQAIETICNISFRDVKSQFIRALQSMGRVTLSAEVKTDDNNNETDPVPEEQNMKSELTLPADVSEPTCSAVEQIKE